MKETFVYLLKDKPKHNPMIVCKCNMKHILPFIIPYTNDANITCQICQQSHAVTMPILLVKYANKVISKNVIMNQQFSLHKTENTIQNESGHMSLLRV